MDPSWRKPFGIFAMLLIILFWAIVVASFSAAVGTLPGIAQAVIYVIAGVVWIVPMKPLLQWMETGRFR